MNTISSEQRRIDFLVYRDGIPKTIEFAERTRKIYRTAVLQSRKRGHKKPHFASDPMYRRAFILSYLELKRFISLNQNY
jgi:hypothetical protein